MTEYEVENYGGRRKLPTVFTEQGIAMLSGLLRNEIAIKVSINIMDAFVEMRKFITLNGQMFQEINTMKSKLLEHDKKFNIVFDELQNKKQSEFKQKIFFNGRIYDAYGLIIDIIKTTKKKILIIYIKELIKCYRNPYPIFKGQKEERIGVIIEEYRKNGISMTTRNIEKEIGR